MKLSSCKGYNYLFNWETYRTANQILVWLFFTLYNTSVKLQENVPIMSNWPYLPHPFPPTAIGSCICFPKTEMLGLVYKNILLPTHRSTGCLPGKKCVLSVCNIQPNLLTMHTVLFFFSAVNSQNFCAVAVSKKLILTASGVFSFLSSRYPYIM